MSASERDLLDCSGDSADFFSSSTVEKVYVGWLLLVAATGLPLNVIVLYRLFVSKRRRPGDPILLYWLLLVSNIAILVLHCCGLSVWCLTFWWSFSDIVCKLYKFSGVLALYLSSAAIVSIAICTSQGTTPKRERRLFLGSVLVGVLLAVRELFVWGTIQVGCIDGTTREQCVYVYGWKAVIAYTFIHSAALFWVPAGVIGLCYVRLALAWCGLAASQSRYGNSCGHSVRPVRKSQSGRSARNSQSGRGKKNEQSETDPSNRLSASESPATLRRPVGSKKGTTVRIIIGALFILSNLPDQVFDVFALYASEDAEAASRTYALFARALIILGPLIGPLLLIYGLRWKRTTPPHFTLTVATSSNGTRPSLTETGRKLTRMNAFDGPRAEEIAALSTESKTEVAPPVEGPIQHDYEQLRALYSKHPSQRSTTIIQIFVSQDDAMRSE